jgi:hypothetical protein
LVKLDHSSLNASIGSTLVARRAGKYVASGTTTWSAPAWVDFILDSLVPPRGRGCDRWRSSWFFLPIEGSGLARLAKLRHPRIRWEFPLHIERLARGLRSLTNLVRIETGPHQACKRETKDDGNH